jgi:hypothetical protein
VKIASKKNKNNLDIFYKEDRDIFNLSADQVKVLKNYLQQVDGKTTTNQIREIVGLPVKEINKVIFIDYPTYEDVKWNLKINKPVYENLA